MTKISENFVIQEFVPPQIYNQFGEKSIWFINPQIIKIAEFVRSFFNKPVTINNWHVGGTYTESGFRMPDTTTGAKLSAHKRGQAVDIKMSGVDYEHIRKTILENEKKFIDAGVTTFEDGTKTWLHLDCRYTMSDKILVVPFQ